MVSELKKLASAAKTVWLASDEDREGEAISWHLYETLGLKKDNTRRIVFHEITKNAILHAIETPRDIDMNLVDAQQARRVLDRLVGFELSPVLWRKVQPKLSAGRVQSVALRLIVDREREILSFKRSSFYRIEALFHPENFPAAVQRPGTGHHRKPGLQLSPLRVKLFRVLPEEHKGVRYAFLHILAGIGPQNVGGNPLHRAAVLLHGQPQSFLRLAA